MGTKGCLKCGVTMVHFHIAGLGKVWMGGAVTGATTMTAGGWA